MSWSPTDSGNFLRITDVFPGASTTSTTVTIPFSALASYGSANSGDFRELVYSVVDAAYERVVDINTDLVAGGSGVLANLTMTRTVDSSNLLADSPTINKIYNISSILNVTGVSYDVAEE